MRDSVLSRGEPRWRSADVAVCAALVLAAVAGYALQFLDVPALTETRDFLIREGWGARATNTWIPSGNDERPFSWALFGWQWRLFGFNEAAVNLFQFLLLGLCGAAIYVHLRQLRLSRLAAAAAGVLWLTSFPVLHAAFWQATQHDKLGALFILLTLIVALPSLGLERLAHRIWASLALSVLSILAVSSKPVAFMLPGALVVQALLFAPRQDWVGYRRAATVLVVPVVSALLFAIGYLQRMDPIWSAHAVEGEVWPNLLTYLRYLANNDHDGALWPAVLLLTPVLVAWVTASWRVRRSLLSGAATSSRGHRDRVLVYLFVLTIGSLAILARASNPVAFYLLIPAFACAGTLTAAAEWLATSGSSQRRAATLLVSSVVATGLLLASAANLRGEGRLGQWTRNARNVAGGYQLLRSKVDSRSLQSILFVLPNDPATFYYLFSSGDHSTVDPTIPSFIFHREVDVPFSTTFGEAPASTAPGELVVTWSDDLHLAEASLGGTSIHRDLARIQSRDYVLGTPIKFKTDGQGRQYTGGGWSPPEDAGRWTDGGVASLVFRIGAPHERPLELVAVTQAFVFDGRSAQAVRVFVNDEPVADWTVRDTPSEYSAIIPGSLGRSGELRLRFEISDPRSPASLGRSTDGRRLGILLQELVIRAASGGGNGR